MLPVRAEEIAAVMGGEGVLGTPVRTIGQLGAVVERGLPKAALRRVVEAVYVDPARRRGLLHAVVAEATFKRRDRLNPAESERTERLARVAAYARHVWGDDEDARAFLTTPHPLLDGRRPIDAAATDLGARQVEAILAAIEHGLPV